MKSFFYGVFDDLAKVNKYSDLPVRSTTFSIWVDPLIKIDIFTIKYLYISYELLIHMSL